MANRIDITNIHDGPRYFTYHIYLQSDGAAGDLDSVTLIGPGDAPYVIEDITWAFNDFSAKVHFELLADDTLIWVLPSSSGNYVNFSKYGGLKDRGNPLDATGKVLISTTGFTEAGDEGSLIIKVRKG